MASTISGMANDFSTQLLAALNKEETPRAGNTPQDARGQLFELAEKVTGAAVDEQLAWADIDSLDRIELLVRVEDKFGVRFDEPPAAQSVGELADYIVTRAEKQ